MKLRFWALGFCFLVAMTSCSSDEPAREDLGSGSHAQNSDADLDGKTAPKSNAAADDDLDAPASAMKSKSVKTASAPVSPSPGDEDLDKGVAAAVDGIDPPPPDGGAAATSENTETESTAGMTRYQIMTRGFERANVMPLVSDFDPLDEPLARLRCLSVKAAFPNDLSEVVIKQMLVQNLGSPDYGPLFPGQAEKVESRLVIGRNNGWINSQNLTNDIRQVFEISRAPGNLVIRIVPNKFGIYQDIPAPAEVWIKKNSVGHLFFKVYKLSPERVRTEVFTGYCYRNGIMPRAIH